ncbi:MAG: sugar kinase [Bacillus sp. (in: firmicutes)]
MNKLDAITFGEAMALFMADELGNLQDIHHFTKALAGAEVNVAVGLSRLGLKVSWMSKVGNDSFGKYIRQYLQKEGVDTSQILMDEENPTGFQLKAKTKIGDPDVQYFRKNTAASKISEKELNQDYIRQTRHLHMTGIPLAVSESFRQYALLALAVAEKQKIPVSFDTNLRPKLWKSQDEMIAVINETAFQCNIILPGIHEGEILTGSKDASKIADFDFNNSEKVELVIVKLGPDGAYYKSHHEEGYVSGFIVEDVVDTVGAGDGFATGVISGLIEGLPIKEAILRGNAIGALAVQSPGDHDGYPTREQLNDFLNNHREGANV